MKKDILLNKFRNKSEEYSKTLDRSKRNYKENAKSMNTFIKECVEEEINVILHEKLESSETLDKILLTNYVGYIVMLEFRNYFWPYDYMTFSRRIGEIWEPFCKLPFQYPAKRLKEYIPPTFQQVESNMNKGLKNRLSNLKISTTEKKSLIESYSEVWKFVDSSSINLKLDLHFFQNNTYYDIDFKSGFNSNEKGNTNRLLQVASIYSSYFKNHKTVIFVRQPEDENNHYLQTLKKSGYWDVYSSEEVYSAILKFTGYDLKTWMDKNMDWKNDISPKFKKYLNDNDLFKYLTW